MCYNLGTDFGTVDQELGCGSLVMVSENKETTVTLYVLFILTYKFQIKFPCRD